MFSQARQPTKSSDTLSELVYRQLKNDIFEFRLVPGQRFTETEIAHGYAVSRTPIRQALYKLQQEGYVDVGFRSGWQIRPLNFHYYEELYDVRIILEQAAIRYLCEQPQRSAELVGLKRIWMIEPPSYIQDIKQLAQQDEDFHCTLVRLGGNAEMARIHQELSEKIRIIRRLDFSKSYRIEATYQEHQQILQSIFDQQLELASQLIDMHIRQSRDEVKKITLQMLDAIQF